MMARDCDELSPKARAIFAKLKPYFPPDPWNGPRWKEGGEVEDNGRFDLRLSTDRKRLMNEKGLNIAYLVELSASQYRKTHGNSLKGFRQRRFGRLVEDAVKFFFLLDDLDFQIETGDLVE